MTEFVDALGFDMNNYLDRFGEEQRWTFESSLGVRRQIDFIMINADLYLLDVFATNSLNLGSDHRAVYVEVSIPRIKTDHEVCYVSRFPR